MRKPTLIVIGATECENFRGEIEFSDFDDSFDLILGMLWLQYIQPRIEDAGLHICGV
ncbi:uncharacterized protein PHALS_07462 [Plasmopara halstedii]|uniref:Uncharacterized protein n=1 Tax=Plasmopara halstedii TaxID=4781 RepID=A0A0P1B6J8_PLAHL|nr:uncharacterized protein PHALS_07462 [Plasmopara halstedii]CEG49710.1 hypothetical protein PHALS_07462 [Plasmopara halstedii]|eukprot:XP_024586079.1 hypothetical protein PHALS_07462 [Plasmopara halstedii]